MLKVTANFCSCLYYFYLLQINHLMDGLHITTKHVGPVLLLEEDHYVAPDFLHVLRMMENLKTT